MIYFLCIATKLIGIYYAATKISKFDNIVCTSINFALKVVRYMFLTTNIWEMSTYGLTFRTQYGLCFCPIRPITAFKRLYWNTLFALYTFGLNLKPYLVFYHLYRPYISVLRWTCFDCKIIPVHVKLFRLTQDSQTLITLCIYIYKLCVSCSCIGNMLPSECIYIKQP